MSTSDGSSRNLADTNTQPAPEHNDKPAVWSLVMRDMTERDIFGAEKYGTRLQPGNGRDFLLDAYQEALDLVVYLRGAIYERDEMPTAKDCLVVETAAAIDDDSPRAQVVQQNGQMAAEVYAAADGSPSWVNAPEWAMWLAQDLCGDWAWYKDLPIIGDDDDEWYSDTHEEAKSGISDNPLWRNTLQFRPIK